MREIRPSGSEGGGTLIGSPYPYLTVLPFGQRDNQAPDFAWILTSMSGVLNLIT
jgi:hypothetical protein